jgi:hypothetical protein
MSRLLGLSPLYVPHVLLLPLLLLLPVKSNTFAHIPSIGSQRGERSRAPAAAAAFSSN